MTPDHDFREYQGRRVTVMGLGSFGGGVGAVKFLAERGANVTVTDLRSADQLPEAVAELASLPVNWKLQRHDETDFRETDLLVVNPAIRRDHPLLQRAQAHGIPLTSEMNLFWQHQRGRIVAVTGSNGKSTTTALLHAILRTTRRAWLGGNIGHSLLPVVDQIQPDDVVVLELSSFQLTDLDRLRVSPQVSVVTNFSPNHLDWHGTLDHYRWAKQTMLRWQGPADAVILNAEDAEVSAWSGAGQRWAFGLVDQGGPGAFLQDETALFRTGTSVRKFPVRDWLMLPGRHNLANALAAITAARVLEADWSGIQTGLETYEPLPHRLQFVGEVQGRRFYNDSLATTPESAMVGLAAFTQPVVLLAGGYDKQVDLTDLSRHIARQAKAVALMGQTAARLQDSLLADAGRAAFVSPPQPDFPSAFRWAWDHSAPGDVVLLSPGCASYDWFRNFADRGMQFQRLVVELRQSTGAVGGTTT